ncbi:hypothetical protein CLIB1423_27S00870 [[Candida] railenensis]|uniref:PB1 domain-containing protein n=1 Tax=[Candida] railenensis TaxID=45579 RepID=A0A9P0QUV7_9ASCO|nr:hypothetical protein CLIB1423_27S00870 [[Candida] railenensis]
MPNTKYTPLEDTLESVNLPPYELNDLNTAEADPDKASSSSDFSDVEATNQPTPVSEDSQALFNSKEDEFEKSYPFKVKSSTIEEGVVRFHYFPKHGIERFRKVIEDKIQYITQSSSCSSCSSCSPFAVGYFDQKKDLISISSDQDLLECIHWYNVNNRYHPSAIKLITYDIRNHAEVAKQYKKRKREKCEIIVASVLLFLFFFVIAICAYFS